MAIAHSVTVSMAAATERDVERDASRESRRVLTSRRVHHRVSRNEEDIVERQRGAYTRWLAPDATTDAPAILTRDPLGLRGAGEGRLDPLRREAPRDGPLLLVDAPRGLDPLSRPPAARFRFLCCDLLGMVKVTASRESRQRRWRRRPPSLGAERAGGGVVIARIPGRP